MKIKAPESVFNLIKEFWDANRHDQTVEWDRVNPYHNSWEAPPSILRVDNSSLVGGGSHLQAAIANAARDAMEVRENDMTVEQRFSRSVLLIPLSSYCHLFICRHGQECHRHQLQFMELEVIPIRAFWHPTWIGKVKLFYKCPGFVGCSFLFSTWEMRLR